MILYVPVIHDSIFSNVYLWMYGCYICLKSGHQPHLKNAPSCTYLFLYVKPRNNNIATKIKHVWHSGTLFTGIVVINLTVSAFSVDKKHYLLLHPSSSVRYCVQDACVSVCMSVQSHISKNTRPNYEIFCTC